MLTSERFQDPLISPFLSEVSNLIFWTCYKLVTILSLRSQSFSRSCSGFATIYPTSSLISVCQSTMPQLLLLMSYQNQFPLLAGWPWRICLCHPHPEPRIVAGRFLFQFQEHFNVLSKKASWIVTSVKARHFTFPKFKHVQRTIRHLSGLETLPTTHVPSLHRSWSEWVRVP